MRVRVPEMVRTGCGWDCSVGVGGDAMGEVCEQGWVTEDVVIVGVPDEMGAVVDCVEVADVFSAEVVPGEMGEGGVGEKGLVFWG